MISVRKARISDAKNLGIFMSQLDKDSNFLLYGTDERQSDTQSVKKYLLRILEQQKSVVFLAENIEKQIIGFLCAEVSTIKRISHVMRINIGVAKHYRGSIASRMLAEKLATYIEAVPIKRVEATIITANLCKKFGFEIEGIKRASIKIDEDYYDEYLLAKIY
jgi:RimJ/RimL family protein N-acetyltransferase